MEASPNVTPQALASRWRRFAAQFIDTLIIMVPYLLFWSVTFGFDDLLNGIQPPFKHLAIGAIVWLMLWLGINYQLLVKSAQTVGKRLLGIKVVLENGVQPNLTVLLGQRYMPYVLCSYIPMIGGLVSIANALWIFSANRQCLHDKLAATLVINA